MIRIMARAQHLVVMKGAALTSGSVGERCEFIFDSAWDGLTKAAVFTAGDECHTVLLTGDSCEVPWECLQTAFIPLTVAVYGHRGTRRVLASDYAELQITEGAEPEDDETTDPTLAVWAQLQESVDNVEDALAEETRARAEADEALGELIEGKQDAISDLDTIRAGAAAGATAIQTETDPTVPSWAKAAQKPTYTAAEVGALAVGYHDSEKQDVIADLATIRSGAAAGATALQSVPNTYRTAAEQDEIHDATKQDKLVAGSGITIAADGKTISSTGGGGGTTAYIGDTEPADAEAGALWIDTSDSEGSSPAGIAVSNYYAGTDNLYYYSTWVRGGMSRGTVTTYRNRVASSVTMYTARPLTLTVESGFKVGVHTMSEADEFVSDSNWKTGSYTIPANTRFRAVIARTTDRSGEKADVAAFVDKVHIQPDLSNKLNVETTREITVPAGTTAGLWFPICGGVNLRGVWFKIDGPNNVIKQYRVYTAANKSRVNLLPGGWYYAEQLRDNNYQILIPLNDMYTDDAGNVTGGTMTLRWFFADSAEITGAAVKDGALTRRTLAPLLADKTAPARKGWITTAHRGNNADGRVAENTLGAFYEAYKMGADRFECDARMASDGVLVCVHDASITVDGTSYTIASTPSTTLNALALSNDSLYGEQTVPLLEDVLRLAYSTGMTVNIDLKTGAGLAVPVAEMVRKCGMRGRAIYGLNGGGAAAANAILAIDKNAMFIETPGNVNTLVQSIDADKCIAYTNDYTQDTADAIRSTGAILCFNEVHQDVFDTVAGLMPEIIEFRYTQNFRVIEDNWLTQKCIRLQDN